MLQLHLFPHLDTWSDWFGPSSIKLTPRRHGIVFSGTQRRTWNEDTFYFFSPRTCSSCIQLNPWNKDTSLLFSVQLVSRLEGFHCMYQFYMKPVVSTTLHVYQKSSVFLCQTMSHTCSHTLPLRDPPRFPQNWPQWLDSVRTSATPCRGRESPRVSVPLCRSRWEKCGSPLTVTPLHVSQHQTLSCLLEYLHKL